MKSEITPFLFDSQTIRVLTVNNAPDSSPRMLLRRWNILASIATYSAMFPTNGRVRIRFAPSAEFRKC